MRLQLCLAGASTMGSGRGTWWMMVTTIMASSHNAISPILMALIGRMFHPLPLSSLLLSSLLLFMWSFLSLFYFQFHCLRPTSRTRPAPCSLPYQPPSLLQEHTTDGPPQPRLLGLKYPPSSLFLLLLLLLFFFFLLFCFVFFFDI